MDLERVHAVVGRGYGQSQRYEVQIQRPDGRSVPVGISFWLLRSGRGRSHRPHRSLPGSLDHQADGGADAPGGSARRPGRLSANIAHEIRNPLASVSGAIEVLVRELPPDATCGRLVEIVLSESARLNQLISDFLEYARPAPAGADGGKRGWQGPR